MAQYIDADKFTERIKASPAFRNIYDGLLLQRVVIDLLNNMPTADVVPKSEVEREIFEEIEREINDAMQSNYKVLPQIEESEALWNRVNGKIDALRGIDGFIEELKKKYTENKE